MRKQAVKIQAIHKGNLDGKPITFEGTLDELKDKLRKLQQEGEFCRVDILENRDKDKKLGMGIRLEAFNDVNYISHQTFWPVKLEKPKHKNGKL